MTEFITKEEEVRRQFIGAPPYSESDLTDRVLYEDGGREQIRMNFSLNKPGHRAHYQATVTLDGPFLYVSHRHNYGREFNPDLIDDSYSWLASSDAETSRKVFGRIKELEAGNTAADFYATTEGMLENKFGDFSPNDITPADDIGHFVFSYWEKADAYAIDALKRSQERGDWIAFNTMSADKRDYLVEKGLVQERDGEYVFTPAAIERLAFRYLIRG